MNLLFLWSICPKCPLLAGNFALLLFVYANAIPESTKRRSPFRVNELTFALFTRDHEMLTGSKNYFVVVVAVFSFEF